MLGLSGESTGNIMKKTTIAFLYLVLSANICAQSGNISAWGYSGSDSVFVISPVKFDYQLIEINNIPESYRGEIITPVCMDGVCQRVHIIIHWDLLGNYRSYELPEGEQLTKAEHEPFSENDYKKLHEILSNYNSLLRDYDIRKLLNETRVTKIQEADGYTGATTGTLQEHIVKGAVYSSYTLWHFVNGGIADTLRSNTISNLLDDKMMIRFLASDNYNYHYAALDYLKKHPSMYNDSIVVRQLSGMLHDKNNVFFSRELLLKLPEEKFTKPLWQKILWSAWPYNNYQVQQLILYKMHAISQHPDVLPFIAECMYVANPLQKKELLDFFSTKKHVEPEILYILAEQLDINQPTVSKKILTLLKEHQQDQKDLQKIITSFEKQSQLLW